MSSMVGDRCFTVCDRDRVNLARRECRTRWERASGIENLEIESS
jgi:hypothetical protein